MKLRSKAFVGIMFLSGGFVTLITSIRNIGDPVITALGIGGGVFLIVDGLYNIREEDEEKKLKKKKEKERKNNVY